jgi:hypothetical protein
MKVLEAAIKTNLNTFIVGSEFHSHALLAPEFHSHALLILALSTQGHILNPNLGHNFLNLNAMFSKLHTFYELCMVS